MLNISAPLLVYRSGRRLYFALLFQKQVKSSRKGTPKRRLCRLRMFKKHAAYTLCMYR